MSPPGHLHTSPARQPAAARRDAVVRSRPVADDQFYKSFSEKQLTGYGSARRSKIERSRLDLLMRFRRPPGRMIEIGPGHGTLGELAVAAGWDYTAIEPSDLLIDVLQRKGLRVVKAFTPPIPGDDASVEVVYADQVMEHMPGIDAARAFTADALRLLTPGGVFFVVVPDYLKERTFFWDVDYTHNFVTTERRMRQLFNDGGFIVEHVTRSIGAATGLRRDVLAAASVFANVPGIDTLSRWTGTEDLLFKVRKNLFETLTFVARKPK
jgi:SAM-dependent methyltransferase